MTSTNTLGYALLGLLSRGKLTGYQLATEFKQTVGYFWTAGHSQIYPELARLESAGLVKHERVVQEHRPNKKIYSITREGKDALRRWLSQPADEAPPRNELLLKAFNQHLAPPDEVLALLKGEQAKTAEIVARNEGIQKMLEKDFAAALKDRDSAEFSAYAAVRAGVAIKRAMADWLTWLTAQVEKRR